MNAGTADRIRVGVVGLGKMGLSHLAMINAHPDVVVAAVCDSATYVLDVLNKYTGLVTYRDFGKMLGATRLDAVIIATPTRLHGSMVRAALDHDLHVFCEKPFVADFREGEQLARLAEQKGRVNQVGYHNRFVGAFQEVKRLLDGSVIGRITHIRAEAFGPVVLKPQGSTWRTRRIEGGGCLYDYAAHPLNLVNWYAGAPAAVGGSVLGRVFSGETEDEVYGTLYFSDGLSAQISTNWSDESNRKMTTRITIWGTQGRICADRQECQVYLRDGAAVPGGYRPGWNVRYTTDLTEPVWFYVRGEEYSSQLAHFIRCIREGRTECENSFASASLTDRAMAMIVDDALDTSRTTTGSREPVPTAKSGRRVLGRWFRRDSR